MANLRVAMGSHREGVKCGRISNSKSIMEQLKNSLLNGRLPLVLDDDDVVLMLRLDACLDAAALLTWRCTVTYPIPCFRTLNPNPILLQYSYGTRTARGPRTGSLARRPSGR